MSDQEATGAQLEESVNQLIAHLQEIIESPSSVQLSANLAETLRAQLSFTNADEKFTGELTARIIPLVAHVLQIVEQDPLPLTLLVERLLQNYSFQQVLTIADSATFLNLLQSPVSANNKLALYLLEKAKDSTGDIAIIATWNNVCKELIKTHLVSEDMGVHEKAERLLVSLLQTDLQAPDGSDIMVKTIPEKRGSGLLWRRIFFDRDIYETILSECSFKDKSNSTRAVTTAQSRLLEFLPQIATMDWATITANPFPDLILAYSDTTLPVTGLLDFAIFGMVRGQSDILMWILHIDFLTALITSHEKALTYLSSQRVAKHQQTLVLYLKPSVFTSDSMEQHMLEDRAAVYIARYSRMYPKHLLALKASAIQIPIEIRNATNGFSTREFSQLQADVGPEGTSLVDLILLRVAQRLDILRDPTIAYNPPTENLNILMSIPPEALISLPIPGTDSSKLSEPLLRRWRASHTILSLVPLSPPHPEYLETLGSTMRRSSLLYSHYVTELCDREFGTQIRINHGPNEVPSGAVSVIFWDKVLATARAPALHGACLAAHAVIFQLSDTQIWDGFLEVLKQPTLMEFLLQSPERHGSRGVPESDSIEYKLALRKSDIAQVLARRVVDCGMDQEGFVKDDVRWASLSPEKAQLVQKWAKRILKRSRSGLWDRRLQPAIETSQA